MTNFNRRHMLGAALGFAASGALAAKLQAASPLAVEKIVNQAAKVLKEQYFDPALGSQMGDELVRRMRSGAYRDASPVQLGERMTADLRRLSNNLHLEVYHESAAPTAENAELLPEDELHPRTTNYGVQTVARLQGNIGLLRITHFPSPPFFFDGRYAAAMELLRDTNALILDLRINHGGGVDTTGYFLSYFIDGPAEFGRIKWRNEPDEVAKTSADITGKLYGEKRPIFVAISRKTFSAAEAVADHLRRFRRSNPAVLVGEQTKGGAHPGHSFPLPNDFQIFVSTGHTDGPNWEGIGIAPDVPASPAEALKVAHRLALQKLLDNSTDPKQREILRNILANRIENLSSFTFG